MTVRLQPSAWRVERHLSLGSLSHSEVSAALAAPPSASDSSEGSASAGGPEEAADSDRCDARSVEPDRLREVLAQPRLADRHPGSSVATDVSGSARGPSRRLRLLVRKASRALTGRHDRSSPDPASGNVLLLSTGRQRLELETAASRLPMVGGPSPSQGAAP